MRKKLRFIISQTICSLIIAGVVYLISKSITLSICVLLVLLLLVMISPAFWILNKLCKRTNWYKNKIGEGAKFLKLIPCDLDICNLGSNSGKYAFSYDETGLKGENWAVGPQTLAYDFRVLKNYFSYLKEGATVLIPLCPFSGCIKEFQNDSYNYKYYSFLHPILILNYSPATKKKVMRFVNTPFNVTPIKALIRLITDIPSIEDIIITKDSLKKDADCFLNSWKNQFSISNLDSPVSKQNLENIAYNISLLSEIIEFCLDRKLKPIIVLPPVLKVLSSKFSVTFRENYIYSFVQSANTKQVPFLNYFDDDRFSDPDYYFNSFFLNASGRKYFTKKVLKELNLVE